MVDSNDLCLFSAYKGFDFFEGENLFIFHHVI